MRLTGKIVVICRMPDPLNMWPECWFGNFLPFLDNVVRQLRNCGILN